MWLPANDEDLWRHVPVDWFTGYSLRSKPLSACTRTSHQGRCRPWGPWGTGPLSSCWGHSSIAPSLWSPYTPSSRTYSHCRASLLGRPDCSARICNNIELFQIINWIASKWLIESGLARVAVRNYKLTKSFSRQKLLIIQLIVFYIMKRSINIIAYCHPLTITSIVEY